MAEKRKEMFDRVYNVDSRLISQTIPLDIQVQTTITSPPYFDMKDYGSHNQVGYGQRYDDYLADLQKIFLQVFQITRNDGTLWIIIDTFKRNNQVVTLPFDLANKLKEIGWLLQDIIIWKKDKTVPWSTNGFMQRKFEYILFFSKAAKYKSNKDKVRNFDTTQLKKWWVKYPERYNPKGKALDEIWEFSIPVQGSWGDEYVKHFCPLPKEMVATMIQISTNENDIVLDPFAGSGTVLSQSAFMKRKYIGFELNTDYIVMFENYLAKNIEKNIKEYEILENRSNQSEFEKLILELRALKFGRVILSLIEKSESKSDLKILVTIIGDSSLKNKSIKVSYEIIGLEKTTEVEKCITESTTKPPLSKFGIEPIFSFSEQRKIVASNLFGYSKTNTYSFLKNVDINSVRIKVISDIEVDLNENDYN